MLPPNVEYYYWGEEAWLETSCCVSTHMMYLPANVVLTNCEVINFFSFIIVFVWMSNRSKWSRWRIAWGSWCLGTKIVALPSQSLWVCEPGFIIFVGKNEGWWWRSCVEMWNLLRMMMYDSACDDVCVCICVCVCVFVCVCLLALPW